MLWRWRTTVTSWPTAIQASLTPCPLSGLSSDRPPAPRPLPHRSPIWAVGRWRWRRWRQRWPGTEGTSRPQPRLGMPQRQPALSPVLSAGRWRWLMWRRCWAMQGSVSRPSLRPCRPGIGRYKLSLRLCSGARSIHRLRDKAKWELAGPGPGQVAAALAAVGKHQEARDAARAITVVDQRDQTMAEVAAALAAVGKHEQGEATAHSIADPYQRGRALAQVAAALAAVGKHQEARDAAQQAADGSPLGHRSGSPGAGNVRSGRGAGRSRNQRSSSQAGHGSLRHRTLDSCNRPGAGIRSKRLHKVYEHPGQP